MARTPRESRSEIERRERRRRPGTVETAGLKLVLDETKLDRNRFHYRHVTAKPERIRHLMAIDYDIATEAANPNTNSGGTVNSVVGGTDDSGAPYNMVLMRKEKDWFETDQAEKMKPLDAMDEQIRRGAEHQGQKLTGSGVYSPIQNQI